MQPPLLPAAIDADAPPWTQTPGFRSWSVNVYL